MIVIFHFEVAPLGPKFVHPITTLELKVFYNVIVFSKYLGQDLSFEGSKIFVSWFFSRLNMGIFCQIANSPILLKISGSQDQANI